MSLALYLEALEKEPLTEMKRRHFIMLAKGRETMKTFLLTLGMENPTVPQIVNVEKAIYLASFDEATLGLEGAYELALHEKAKALTAHLQEDHPDLLRVYDYFYFVEEGSLAGHGEEAVTKVVKDYLETMKALYASLPPPMKEEGKEAALRELAKWEERLGLCGLTLKEAERQVLDL